MWLFHNDDKLAHLGWSQQSRNEVEGMCRDNEEGVIINSTFVREFLISVRQYVDTACFCCDRLMYSNGLRRARLFQGTELVIKELCPGFTTPAEHVSLCHRCFGHNAKGKITNQAKWHVMTCDSVPEELEVLSDVEITLISQIRPFMKIFHLSGGRGQFGIKGGVIHFPQSVEELVDQLPLRAEHADMIVVNQTLENINSNREFSVRPDTLRRALEWLESNNKLYSHVQISEENLNNVNINHVVSEMNEHSVARNANEMDVKDGYRTVSNGTKTLQGTLHQSSIIFTGRYAGS